MSGLWSGSLRNFHVKNLPYANPGTLSLIPSFFRVIANEGANIQTKIGASYLGYLIVASKDVEQLNTGKNRSKRFFIGLKSE
jgi:hypothetical protein